MARNYIGRNAKPVTVKIAAFSARHRWLVFGLWFVLIAGLVFGSSVVPATDKKYDAYASFDWESVKGWKALTADGGETNPQMDFYLLVSKSGQNVSDPAFKETVGKMTQALGNFKYTENGATQPVFTKLVNPYEAPAEAGLISQDGTTVRIYGQIEELESWQNMKERLEPVEPKLTDLKAQFSDYNLLVKNTYFNWASASKEGSSEAMQSMLITLIPTFLILFFVFRAFVASIVPLILAITAIVGTTGVMSIYTRLTGNNDITQALMLGILMGLAVAVDYSLFVISRYRHERQLGRDKLTAIEIASGTAGRAVFFSGVLVAISISGLFILGSIFIPMAIGVISVVLLSVLGSITFLPATLSILGKGIEFGRVPFLNKGSNDGKGFWAAIVGASMRRAVVITVLAITLLVVLASPLLHIKLGISVSADPVTEGQKATALIQQKWPQSADLRLTVTVTQADKADTQAAMKQFEVALLQKPGLSGPVSYMSSRDGKVVMMSFYQSGTWNDDRNIEVVKQLRSEVVPAYFKSLPNVEAYVGGMTAQNIDQTQFFMNPTVWLFVLGLSFLVLLMVFRSVVIPVKAIILNLLSTGAAYGVVILFFQDGRAWIKGIGVMESWLPVFIFAIIFGLSMDYHMFILTRIKELRDAGFKSNMAVLKGISSTSGTITGAAAIMVVVFGDFFVSLSDVQIQQFGLGLAVAVFLDATIVRCMLLPAVMRLMGEFNWYMPKFLKWLPTITVESEPEHLPTHTTGEKETDLAAA
ncbi:MAG: MMPL family transporter [Chloroflexi bacterium]|uniref:MMPL family transporter n=1 Tax=Candidatus Chlorohelix allophototropha TaxID=3003348 RepID=A0A8T7M784_9CHLR|nr:MMPL family transporter [Chloroflexota bacterium]WJW69884.1 MMPL family transporter [Chloroflexota bacterium L227-S17]